MVAAAASPPPFMAKVEHVAAAQLPYSWRPGCPVGPAPLRRIRLRYMGFDGRAHTGQLIVNARVTGDVIRVFGDLYRAQFPIRKMRPVDVYHGSDTRSTAADNTSSFNCRYAVAPGTKHWSMHAYGEAIDINTVENPYLEGGRVLPPSGAAYADRSRVRRGMAIEGRVLVRAFDAVGWGWGGRWSGGTKDYQHFSVNGR